MLRPTWIKIGQLCGNTVLKPISCSRGSCRRSRSIASDILTALTVPRWLPSHSDGAKTKCNLLEDANMSYFYPDVTNMIFILSTLLGSKITFIMLLSVLVALRSFGRLFVFWLPVKILVNDWSLALVSCSPCMWLVGFVDVDQSYAYDTLIPI